MEQRQMDLSQLRREGEGEEVQARIEIFKQIDIPGLKTGDDEEIRNKLNLAGLGSYFHEVIQIVGDDEELTEE